MVRFNGVFTALFIGWGLAIVFGVGWIVTLYLSAKHFADERDRCARDLSIQEMRVTEAVITEIVKSRSACISACFDAVDKTKPVETWRRDFGDKAK